MIATASATLAASSPPDSAQGSGWTKPSSSLQSKRSPMPPGSVALGRLGVVEDAIDRAAIGVRGVEIGAGADRNRLPHLDAVARLDRGGALGRLVAVKLDAGQPCAGDRVREQRVVGIDEHADAADAAPGVREAAGLLGRDVARALREEDEADMARPAARRRRRRFRAWKARRSWRWSASPRYRVGDADCPGQSRMAAIGVPVVPSVSKAWSSSTGSARPKAISSGSARPPERLEPRQESRWRGRRGSRSSRFRRRR